MTHSKQRIDALLALSQEVYVAIDERPRGTETRARHIVRLGIVGSAVALRAGASESQAGTLFHATLLDQLERGGLPLSHAVYRNYPQYIQTKGRISDPFRHRDSNLEQLANKYSDVRRVTQNAQNEEETDASHAIHLASLALPYAAEYYPHLDQGKIALYCLIHDILEAYVGDIATLGISEEAHQQKQLNEQVALATLSTEFHASWPEFVNVIDTYESLSNSEARYVKSFDKLDPWFTHFVNDGRQLINYYGYMSSEQFIVAAKEATTRMASYSSDFPDLLTDRQELLDRVTNYIDWPDNKTPR